MKIIAQNWKELISGFRGELSAWGMVKDMEATLTKNPVYTGFFVAGLQPKFSLQKDARPAIAEDFRHVSPKMVETITGHFVDHYFL